MKINTAGICRLLFYKSNYDKQHQARAPVKRNKVVSDSDTATRAPLPYTSIKSELGAVSWLRSRGYIVRDHYVKHYARIILYYRAGNVYRYTGKGYQWIAITKSERAYRSLAYEVYMFSE